MFSRVNHPKIHLTKDDSSYTNVNQKIFVCSGHFIDIVSNKRSTRVEDKVNTRDLE